MKVIDVIHNNKNNQKPSKQSSAECLVRKFSLNQTQLISSGEAAPNKSRRKSVAETVTNTAATVIMSSWSSTTVANKPPATNTTSAGTMKTIEEKVLTTDSTSGSSLSGEIDQPKSTEYDRLGQRGKNSTDNGNSDTDYWDMPAPVGSGVNNNDDYIKNSSSLTKGLSINSQKVESC